MENETKTGLSPMLIIGFIFIMNGIVMAITLGLAFGFAFLGTGMTFAIIGLTSNEAKGGEKPGP